MFECINKLRTFVPVYVLRGCHSACWSFHNTVSHTKEAENNLCVTTLPVASSPLSNFIFRLFSGTRGFSYEARGLVGTCSSSFSGLSRCVSSCLSIPLCSSPLGASGATRPAVSWPPWVDGGSGLVIGGQCSVMEAGLDRGGGRERELDWLGGGTDEGLFWACSQRFFRALRLPERREEDALSKDCEEDKKRLKI